MRRRTLLVSLAAMPLASRVMAQPREIEITARKFAYTPNEITLKAGESVVLVFRAIDFPHGFTVPDLKLRADLTPGKAVRVALRAPATASTLEFLCDNFCGDGHEQMHGRFLVV